MIVQRIPCGSNTGLGCPGCGGACKEGLGFFSSGLKFSQWGIAEWGTVAAAVALAFSMFGGKTRGRRNPRRRRR